MQRPKLRSEPLKGDRMGRGGLDHGWYGLRTPGRRARAAARRVATTLFKRHAALSGGTAKAVQEFAPRPVRHASGAPEARPGNRRTRRTTPLAHGLWWLALAGALVTVACLIVAVRMDLVWPARGVLYPPSRAQGLTPASARATAARQQIVAFLPVHAAPLVEVGAPARIRLARQPAGEDALEARVTWVGKGPLAAHDGRTVRVELQLNQPQTPQLSAAPAETPVTVYIALRKPHPLRLLRERLAVLNARWRTQSSGTRLR